MQHVVALPLFASVAAVTPGPSNTMLTAVGACAGILRGLPSLFGVMTGIGLMMSWYIRAPESRPPAPLLLWALEGSGAAFLLWL